MFERRSLMAAAALAACLVAGGAYAADVTFTDPTGDDNGPGTYIYPTDAVYTRGSFDITEFALKSKGSRATVEVSVNSNLEDPWGMDVGFSVQMVFIFIDTDGKEGSGHTEGLPGLNLTFAPDSAWEKVIILSPQPSARVRQEVEAKAGALAADIIIPSRVSGSGRTISGQVKLSEIGEGDPTTWGYQVVMQSNEGFPAEGDLLTRKVNEFEGQHRFGGGTDYDCDPHAIDILGDASQLQYECNADGTAKKGAVLKMMRL
ncbi:MAG: hypothetical protein KDD11_15740 [Acidobacteria bacterium]|nr:hypothetical protein [Acidobacteriota bacterium]